MADTINFSSGLGPHRDHCGHQAFLLTDATCGGTPTYTGSPSVNRSMQSPSHKQVKALWSQGRAGCSTSAWEDRRGRDIFIDP